MPELTEQELKHRGSHSAIYFCQNVGCYVSTRRSVQWWVDKTGQTLEQLEAGFRQGERVEALDKQGRKIVIYR